MNRWIFGALFIVLGVMIAVGLVTIFPVCGEGFSRDTAEASDTAGATGAMQMGDTAATAAPMGDMRMATAAPEASASMASMDMSVPMKCHWTARAELGIGILIVLIGLLLLLFSSKKIRLGLTLALTPAGILALLIPVWLIGVCGNAHMSCHALSLPALTVLGGVTAFIALLNAAFLGWSASKKQAQA